MDSTKNIDFSLRDGTGQKQRHPAALDPEYFRLDDREHSDLLRYVRELAKHIRYVEGDGSLQLDKAGNPKTWSAFLSDDPPLEVIVAYLRDPEAFATDSRREWFSRPHFVLFLTFLELLGRVRSEMNRFTKRHLEFYYGEVLGLKPRPATPDSVHLLLEIARGVTNYSLPAGTMVQAGKDEKGFPRNYRTNREITVNNVQVDRVSNLFIEREWQSLERYFSDLQYQGTKDNPFMQVLKLVYAFEDGLLIPFTFEKKQNKVESDSALYQVFQPILDFSQKTLHLSLSEFRRLMQINERRINDGEAWEIINTVLASASRKTESSFEEPKDFARNFNDILGFSPFTGDPFIKELQGVEDIFDLYEQLEEALKQEDSDNAGFYGGKLDRFRNFIQTWLFKSAGDIDSNMSSFRKMMYELTGVRNDWIKINRLLAKAAKGEHPDFERYWPEIPSYPEYPDLDSRLSDALQQGKSGPPFPSELAGSTINTAEGYWDLLKAVEAYFFLPFEEVKFIIDTIAYYYDTSNKKAILKAIAAENLPRVFLLLEKAYRERDIYKLKGSGLPDPVPGREIYAGVYASADTTAIHVPNGNGSQWRPFGVAAEDRLAEIGLAFRSPLLHLAEGKRKIGLTMEFNSLANLGDVKWADYFSFWLSSNESWIKIKNPSITKTDKTENSLTIDLNLDLQDPSITAPAPGLFPGNPSDPVLKMVLNQKAKSDLHPYLLFKDLVLQKINLSITVTGLTPTLAENDNGPVNPRKPFQPFGSMPVVGSTLLLAHPEVCFKPLSAIGFQFDWKGVPEPLNTYYDKYSNPPDKKTAKVSLNLLQKGIVTGDDITVGLFSDFKSYGFPRDEYIWSDLSKETIIDWDRYLRLELQTDFGHTEYPRLAAQQKGDINPPYTPQLKTLKLYYQTTESDLFDAKNAGRHEVMHLHPFGYQKIVKGQTDLYLMPDYLLEGELYIGLSSATPPEQITLLFQLAEGSANPVLEKSPPQWSYLSAGGWLPFDKGEILFDETDGFSNSGIVQLLLPEAAVSDNPLLPTGLHWLRVAVAANRTGVCDIIDIRTQAVTATRVMDPESAVDPGQALPPETVKGFYDRQPGLKSILQPYASFGGRSAESESDFYTRSSERLRHRGRALTLWDVERLVLQEFPDVYKVKCLPATDPSNGEVKVVVIPDIRGKALYDVFQPRMPVSRLAAVGAWLNTHGSALARFHAVNPVYVTIEVEAFVQFYPGYDPRYYLGLLEEDIKRFLSPWAYDSGADIALNHTIYPSVIVNFMEERPYVDYVAGVKIYQIDAGIPVEIDPDGDGAAPPAGPDVIWVSGRKHRIELAEKRPDQVGIGFGGIGNMRIEYDFYVELSK